MTEPNKSRFELRPYNIEIEAMRNPEGSARVQMGNTVVLCAASVEERVPPWLKNRNQGWVTAEYSMLPRASNERTNREAVRGKQGGRTMEIQRLIGRSLRSVVDLQSLGQRSITVDCDVLEADGGTRTASITGACVALHQALTLMVTRGKIPFHPMRELVAAVSVGMVRGEPTLDLCYEEDSQADVDMNVVMTSSGKFVEVQGTAEGEPFSGESLQEMLDLAQSGIQNLLSSQRKILGIQEDARV